MAPRQTGPAGQTVTGALATREKGGAEVDAAVAAEQNVRTFVTKIEGELAKQLPPHIPVEYFSRTVLTGLRKSPELANVARTDRGRASIYAALLEAARFGLMPFTEEGAVVAFGGEATWIPQWQGLVKMMHNTGDVAAVEARHIHKNDTWSLAYGDGGGFRHVPLLITPEGEPVSDEDRGPRILAYFYVVYRDGSRSAVTLVTRQEAERVRDTYSKSYRRAENNGRKNSTWHTEFDPMWLKTAIRQGAGRVRKSAMMAELLLAAARDDVHAPPAAAPPKPSDLGGADVLEGEALYDSAEDGQDATGATEDTRWGQDPADPGPAEPQPDPAGQARRMQALLTECGLAGTAHRDQRLGVVAFLARAGDGDPALPIKSSKDLTPEQVARVVAKLTDIRAAGEPEAALYDGMLRLAAAGGWTPGD
jgi:phage RecT family recombinase